MRAVGIDLGGTKAHFGIVDERINLSDEQRIPTPSSWEEMKEIATKIVRDYQEKYDDLVGVGFGIPGMIGTNGYAYFSPNFPSLNRGVSVEREMRDALSLPVVIDNDNNCAGYAEANFGAAKGQPTVVTIGLGTGIGGSFVVDGKVFRGAHGFAGDFGHMTVEIDGPLCACGKRGCFEALASGSALGRMGREHAEQGKADGIVALAGSVEAIEGYHVGQAAQKKDSGALEVMDEYAHNISRGIASLTEALDPNVFVISGGVVELGETLFAPLVRHHLADLQGNASRPAPQILPAAFGEKSGVVGAGAMALKNRH